MDTRSLQPPKPRRPMRRSMAELFGSTEAGAVVERPPPGPLAATPQRSPTTPRGESSYVRPGRARKSIVDGRRKESQDVAVPRLPLAGKFKGSAPAAERMLRPLDKVTLAATAARYANRLVSTTVPADLAGDAASRPREQERSGDTPELERPPAGYAEAMDEYRSRALELINANLNASLEYAWRLAGVKSPAEFVELSANHACGHFKLIMTLRLHLVCCPGFLSFGTKRTRRDFRPT
jgi:hypothetical protein